MSPHLLIKQTDVATPLGSILLARDAHGLCGVWFEGQKYHPGMLAVPRDDQDPLLKQAADWLIAYFAGMEDVERGVVQNARSEGPAAAMPQLSLRGTEFQQAVWRELLQIPFGQTVSYGDLAARLGRREAVRAVAAAVGRNPVSVLVPCHRVVGSNGQLTGYAGGLDRKRSLLALEAQAPFTLQAQAPFALQAQAPLPPHIAGTLPAAPPLASDPTPPPQVKGWAIDAITPAAGAGRDSPSTTRSSGTMSSSHLQGAGA